MKHRYIVTGSSGFIGNHLVSRLMNKSIVVGVDKNPLSNGKTVPSLNVKVDISKDEIEPQAETIFHIAGIGGVEYSIKYPEDTLRDNVQATLRILEKARKDSSKVILASSSAVYGDGYCESPSLKSIYAVSKKMVENLAEYYARSYNMDITVVRPFTVYGPQCRTDMLVYKVIHSIWLDTTITVNGDGNHMRSFTYVDDVTKVLELCEGLTGFNIVNAGNDISYSINQLIDMAAMIIGRGAKTSYAERKWYDVLVTKSNNDHTKKLLGYSPDTSLFVGLRKTFLDYKKYS